MSQHYIGRAAEAAARAKANASRKPQPVTQQDMRECVQCLYGVVSDVLPQIGQIVLQDYERLNRGLILADRILGRKAGYTIPKSKTERLVRRS